MTTTTIKNSFREEGYQGPIDASEEWQTTTPASLSLSLSHGRCSPAGGDGGGKLVMGAERLFPLWQKRERERERGAD